MNFSLLFFLYWRITLNLNWFGFHISFSSSSLSIYSLFNWWRRRGTELHTLTRINSDAIENQKKKTSTQQKRRRRRLRWKREKRIEWQKLYTFLCVCAHFYHTESGVFFIKIVIRYEAPKKKLSSNRSYLFLIRSQMSIAENKHSINTLPDRNVHSENLDLICVTVCVSKSTRRMVLHNSKSTPKKRRKKLINKNVFSVVNIWNVWMRESLFSLSFCLFLDGNLHTHRYAHDHKNWSDVIWVCVCACMWPYINVCFQRECMRNNTTLHTTIHSIVYTSRFCVHVLFTSTFLILVNYFILF